MKKLFLALTLITGIGIANAQQDIIGLTAGIEKKQQEKPILSFAAKNQNNVDGALALHRKAAEAGEILPGEIIWEKPEGTEVQYEKNAISYRITMGTYYATRASGYVASVVYADDDVVYIKDPCTFKAIGTWIKGKKEGDYIVCEPQPIYHETGQQYNYETGEYEDYEYHYSIRHLHCDLENQCYYLAEDQSFRYKITENGLELDLPIQYDVAGLFCDEDQSFVWYGDMEGTYKPFEAPLTEVPSGLKTETYNFKRSGYVSLCEVGFDGNDVYFGGMPHAPEGVWIKGTLTDDNKIIVKTGQYLGNLIDNEFNERTVYYMASRHIYTEDYIPGYFYFEHEPIDQVEFEYDPETKSFTNISEGSYYDGTTLVVNYGTTLITGYDFNNCTYIDMLFTPYVDKAATPVEPTLVDLAPFYSYYGYSYLGLRLNPEGTQGEYLKSDNLYYRIWVDDKPLTLTTDIYEDLTEDMTYIPADFTSEKNVIIDEEFTIGYHRVFFYFDDFEFIGAQAVYRFDGQEYYSKIAGYNMVKAEKETREDPEHGVTGVEMNVVKAAEPAYFDIMGNRLTTPKQGINIRRAADGTVTKVYVK